MGKKVVDRRRRRAWKSVVGILFSVACLWWALRGMLKEPGAFEQILGAFRNADYRSLPAVLVILCLFYWLKAVRWSLLLSPVGRFWPIKDLLGPIMIGFAFNNILPARIGEVIRISVFAKRHQQSMAMATSTVVLERVFDGMAIVFYLAIGLLFVEGLDPRIRQGALGFAVVACCIVAGALAYVIWTQPFIRLFESVMKKLPLIPHRITDKICGILERGAIGLASLKDPRLVILIVLISMIKWALNGALVLLSLWSFGLPHYVPIAMVLLGAIAFGIALPSSPGYIGVMQAIFIEVMKFFTSDQEGVFAASIYFQFSQWVPVTTVGLLCFFFSGVTLKQVEQTAPDLSLENLDPVGPNSVAPKPVTPMSGEEKAEPTNSTHPTA